MKNIIGVIGAMQPEIDELLREMKDTRSEVISGATFYEGKIGTKDVVVVKCGIGKVFAALTAEAMILRYHPDLVINTGVGGTLTRENKQGDIVYAEKLVQHDMDTSPIGDPVGLISGINKVFFEADEKVCRLIGGIGAESGITVKPGIIASGDQFVSTAGQKEKIVGNFGATVCEMEGASIAHVCFVNETPCAVIRAISDGADEDAAVSYAEFLGVAAKKSAELTLALIAKY